MKFYITLLLVFTLTLSIAQDGGKDEAMTAVAKEVCEKLDNLEIDPKATLKQKEMRLGLIMIQSYNKVKKDNAYLQSTTLSDMEALGEDIGLKMATLCPDNFFKLFSDNELEDIVEESSNSSTSSVKSEDLSLDVKVKSLKNDDISSIIAEDSFGKTHTFIVLDQFVGANLLTKKNLKKDFTIFYAERDIFDLSEKRYIKKKVINYLKLAE